MSEKETRLKLVKAAKQFHDETGAGIMISEAPADPEKKKDWVEHMARIQIAMLIDEGADCAFCGHIYTSVDDFLQQNVREGYPPDRYVCDKCWPEYEKRRNKQ